MMMHKFQIGQVLHFSPALGEDHRKRGHYKVVQQLPEANNMLQYRIKNEADGHERVVQENQVHRHEL